MAENLDVIRTLVKEILAQQQDLSKQQQVVEKKARKPYTRRDLTAYERAKETNLMSRKLTNAINHAEKLRHFQEGEWEKLQESSLLTHPKIVPKKERLERLFSPLKPRMEVDEPTPPVTAIATDFHRMQEDEGVSSASTKPIPAKRRALELEDSPRPPIRFSVPQTPRQKPSMVLYEEEVEEEPPKVVLRPKPKTQPSYEAVPTPTVETQVVMPPIQKPSQERLNEASQTHQDDALQMYLDLIS